MVGVNWTRWARAKSFSLLTVPSRSVTSRSPQILMATKLYRDWARSTISRWVKLTFSMRWQ